MTSPWISFPIVRCPPLARNLRADACVIGAGIAGMTTAYLLAQKGRSVVVLDDGPIGGGMTSRTMGEVTTAIDGGWLAIDKIHGPEGARLAASSHAGAIDAIEGIVRREGIECDLERIDGFVFAAPDGDPKGIGDECAAAVRAGIEGVELAGRAPIDGFDTGRCVRFPRQGQLHPLKYLAGLARGIERDHGAIHCGTRAEEVRDADATCVITREGYRVDCGAIVIANDETPMNATPHVTYVIAARVPRGTVARVLLRDNLDPAHHVRMIPDPDPHGEILLVGGEGHEADATCDESERYAALERWMRERFPMTREILHRWPARVMKTPDRVGFAGRKPGCEHVYVASGDCGMRLTHGTIAGLVITDLVHGAEVPWARLYDPARLARDRSGYRHVA